MDSKEASPAFQTVKDVDISKIEAMVTPEQVFSASVARKRRVLTRKQSSYANKRREQTPCRDLLDESDRNDEIEESVEIRHTTPRRPHRKIKSTERIVMSTDSSLKSGASTPSLEGRNSVAKNFLEDLKDKTENLAELAQNELNTLINKSKKSFYSAAQHGRRFQRKKKQEETKRSQSVPYQFTEEELIDGLRKKNLINGVRKSSSFRRLSNSSLKSDCPEMDVEVSKTFRPEVQEIIRKRREMRLRNKSNISNKIIEVLDPATKDIICTKTLIKGHVGLRELFLVLKIFKIVEIRREYKKFKEEMRVEMDRIKVLRNRCFNELFVVILFCGIGGFIFKFTEGAFENFYKCGVKRVKRDFIDLLWVRSHSMREDEWKSLARNRLRIFEEELHAAHEAGMTSYSGQRSWSFLNGIVYSITVISTIGYGHIYPTTMTGRALTIVYSLIGIPIFLLALTDFGKLFTRCIKFLWSFVRRLYYTGSCRNVRKQAQVQEIFKGAQMMYDIATFRRPSAVWDPEDPTAVETPQETPTTPAISNFEIDDEFNLPISVAIFILLMYIFFGAFFYGYMEGWNFFQSFYFVFISMSTIGFGDLVPNNPLCTIISIVYLVFGLALMSMCINVVQEKMSDTFKSASAKIGASLGVTVAAEDGSIITVPRDTIEMPPVHDYTAVEKSYDGINEEEKTNKISFEEEKR
ncbi:uncharacterized protein LOC123314378 isoform X1 [Coccinella septempunctata]|uniref:uncharacterized protein LOC123314378 isoform X1 n=1 Tax=Coccinella septempunctata TaxID=41139 RepID=UPI001D06FE8D|nr:uncharacterized protein LOC123314378 isoform X1 [Coccinella septempunctata]